MVSKILTLLRGSKRPKPPPAATNEERIAGMNDQATQLRGQVGPVLTSGTVTEAILEAIQALNPQAVIQDRGSYVRVLSPHRCIVTADAVEQLLGEPFRLPGDLERRMPAFKGNLAIDDKQAVWEYRGRADA